MRTRSGRDARGGGLEVEPQRELDLARQVCLRIDDAEVGRTERGARKTEDRRVSQIEGLRAELQAETFPNYEVLEQ